MSSGVKTHFRNIYKPKRVLIVKLSPKFLQNILLKIIKTKRTSKIPQLILSAKPPLEKCGCTLCKDSCGLYVFLEDLAYCSAMGDIVGYVDFGDAELASLTAANDSVATHMCWLYL